jgi:hypothetical protein
LNNQESESLIIDTKTVKGKITDESGSPIPGVNILIKGTNKGVSSNIDGTYNLSVSDDKAILAFSFVGFITQEVVVGNRSMINISLLSENKALSEVVVVEVKPGIYELKTAPDARTLHRMKLALDDLIADNTSRNAITGVKTGQLNTDGRTYQGLKTKLLGWMDNNIVDAKGKKLYAEARNTYAGDAAIIDAMDRGASLYKLHPNTIVAEFKKLDPSEKDAFRVGVVKAIEDKMLNSTEGAATVYKIFGKNANSKEYAQLKAIFDNPADFETFKQRLLVEVNMGGTEKLAKTNLASSGSAHVERPEFYPVTKRHFVPKYFLDAIEPSEAEKNMILNSVLTPHPQGSALLKQAEESAKPGALSKAWEYTRPTRLLNRPLIPGSYMGTREPSIPEDQQPFALPTPQENVLEVLKPRQYKP